MGELETLSVMGLPIHCGVCYEDWLLARHSQGLASHVVTLNAEMAMQADQNPALKEVLCQADLAIPDGAGIVLYFRIKGKRMRRYPGIELAESLLAKLDSTQSVFFLGAAPEVAEKAAHNWQIRQPGLAIAGVQHGYFSAEELPDIEKRLEQLQPTVILVALGVPRQEFWIRERRHLCPQAVWVGVGGSFDIWAGLKERAPAWFCNNNLEWLYRLYQEPWRWRRMLALPQFAVRALTYSSGREG
ncbi:WecB/TagA/CpsF family glycosyltransferase [Oscillatoria sp. CS-180]|uniref:WecB/TagA/CpsF family glycosyltransferase n=1 Tax=Oscillatoria sp. CS-180 TaxID=3021720 RepID=UPI00232BA841|nr:WecB/TagA/CpsF family glycosyltransferase [Oscillatoria sp. CS-180]MDB9528130.1 WecB/TagA/CpsF family glycosyltransferase [Oscillatoria sp. CS-180]